MPAKHFYVFYYEQPTGHPPKEFQGPFPTKKAAKKARDKDAKTYGTPIKDYKIQYLSEWEFKDIWRGMSNPSRSPSLTEATVARWRLPPSDAGLARRIAHHVLVPAHKTKNKSGWLTRKLFGS